VLDALDPIDLNAGKLLAASTLRRLFVGPRCS
jgi:hypothetical protein